MIDVRYKGMDEQLEPTSRPRSSVRLYMSSDATCLFNRDKIHCARDVARWPRLTAASHPEPYVRGWRLIDCLGALGNNLHEGLSSSFVLPTKAYVGRSKDSEEHSRSDFLRHDRGPTSVGHTYMQNVEFVFYYRY
jgi:hypothetical protein